VIQFSDAPYQFFEAKPSPFLIRFGRVMNQRFFLPGPNHRIREMLVDGATDEIREAIAKGGTDGLGLIPVSWRLTTFS